MLAGEAGDEASSPCLFVAAATHTKAFGVSDFQDAYMTAITIVIPVYSGVEYLSELILAIDDLRNSLSSTCPEIEILECICVSDNARDGSYELLQKLTLDYNWLHTLSLSRNFGQHPATVAGIIHSSGDWIVTLDEDLQHDPRLIPRLLLRAVQNGYDVVYAKPANDGTHSGFRNVTSVTTKWLIASLSGISSAPLFNSYRLIRGAVARAAASGCSTETYLDVALSWYSNSVGSESIKMVDKRTQEGSRSGYSLSRLKTHAVRLAISSDVRLMHFGARLGFLGASAGLTALLSLVLAKYFFPEWASDARGWASLIAVILLVNGLIMFQVGLALRFLTAGLQRAQGRPCFFTVDRTSDQQLAVTLAKNLVDLESQLELR